MRRNNPIISVACLGAAILILAGSAATVRADNPGEAGMLSLRLGVGAREAGMGDAGAATSVGAAAIFWNPANNVLDDDLGTELILQHHRYLGLFNHEAAAVAHRVGKGVIGVLFSGFYSDDIDRYSSEPVAEWQGTFRPSQVAFGLSYAHPLGKNFGLGVTAKLISERIDIYSDSGFAFDIGISHKAVIEGLVFAATYTNLGGQMNLNAQPYDLPGAFRLGLAWAPPKFISGKMTLAGDVVVPNDGTEKAHLGAEFRLVPELSLRLGTRLNYESQGLTAGAGFNVGKLTLDYAYSQWTEEGFEDGHRFALLINW